MEPNFIKASSENLPEMNYVMIQEFFAKNLDYISVEYRSVKNVRASRAGYGDDAVGYVQVKREGSLCTVKGKIVPEHRVHNQLYNLTAVIDEGKDTIVSCQCESCAAALGGCKHAIAFLYWILRRNDEKSPTSVECYWNKPTLSRVATTMKYIKAVELKSGGSGPSAPIVKIDNFLEKVIEKAQSTESSAHIVTYFTPSFGTKQLSIHNIMHLFLEQCDDKNVVNFLSYCSAHMKEELCALAEKDTLYQSKSSLWYELRYGRITASKIYEAACCNTKEGVLVERIFGASTMPQTDAMRRGLILEDKVLEVVAKKYNVVFKKTGLILNRKYPVLGASPDGISETYVVEIKCPSKKSSLKNYIKPNGRVTPKYLAQIHLQMLFCGKEKGLFCIADPDFENNKEVKIFVVDFNKGIFIKSVIENAMNFWKSAIFPVLIR